MKQDEPPAMTNMNLSPRVPAPGPMDRPRMAGVVSGAEGGSCSVAQSSRQGGKITAPNRACPEPGGGFRCRGLAGGSRRWQGAPWPQLTLERTLGTS